MGAVLRKEDKMANMILDGYTFPINPEITFDILKKKKYSNFVETYTSIAFFSWGTSIIGKEVEIGWPWMDKVQFDQLQFILEKDMQVVFDPTGNGTFQFNVNLLDLDGKYWLRVIPDVNGDPVYKDIKLKMVIMSEA